MIDSIDLELLWKTGAFIQSTNTGIIVILVYIVMQLVISYIRPKKKNSGHDTYAGHSQNRIDLSIIFLEHVS